MLVAPVVPSTRKTYPETYPERPRDFESRALGRHVPGTYPERLPMPYLLSEDFVRNKLGRLMTGRDERLLRDSKLTGFALRVRHAADGSTFTKDWFALQPVPGKSNPKKIPIGNHPTFNAEMAREQAQTMLQAVKRGDDPVAERDVVKI